CARLLGGFDYW
nr:immunoglobulin heavy chain junction region [Macaca mulatta]MOV43323.1 immunoglobulin heavy chain junction region [Macaca mulatta]